MVIWKLLYSANKWCQNHLNYFCAPYPQVGPVGQNRKSKNLIYRACTFRLHCFIRLFNSCLSLSDCECQCGPVHDHSSHQKVCCKTERTILVTKINIRRVTYCFICMLLLNVTNAKWFRYFFFLKVTVILKKFQHCCKKSRILLRKQIYPLGRGDVFCVMVGS